MRILHLTEGFWPRIGGLEVLVQNLSQAQCHAGHRVGVLTNHLGGLPQRPAGLPPEIEIQRVPFRQALTDNDTARVGAVVRETAALKRSFQPDVIHLHANGYIPWLHLLTAGASSAPCVVTLHTPVASMDLPPAIMERMLRSAAQVVGVSEATRRDWAQAFPEPMNDSGVILNGVREPTAPTPPLRLDPAILLCLGRLDPLKGFDVALRAFARLSASRPALRLVIAGDGPARAELEKLSSALGVTPRVTFRGWVAPDEVAAGIGAASVVLMPSRWEEPFGLVAVEAAFAGRPLVASRKGGLAEIVRDGETGLLFPAGDDAALAAAVDSLLRDPDRTRRLAAAAQARARADFTLTRCAAEYETLYRRLSAASPANARA